MNRAWIPAGALAGVSVAGLIALGQLTDSLGTPVSFPASVAVTTPVATHAGALPVSVDFGTQGHTTTASLRSRGGSATAPPVNSDTGAVGYRRAATPRRVQPATLNSPPSATSSSTTSKPKKAPKRHNSIISGTSGPTGDTGLTSGGSSSGTSSTGEQSSKLSSDPPSP